MQMFGFIGELKLFRKFYNHAEAPYVSIYTSELISLSKTRWELDEIWNFVGPIERIEVVESDTSTEAGGLSGCW